MKQNRKRVELQNIGKKIAGRLNEIGIFSEEELRFVNSVEAHRRIAGSDHTNPLIKLD